MEPSATGPTDAALDRIFTDSDSPETATRAKAAKELGEFGESAVPGVRDRLGANPAPEMRRRVGAFLGEFDAGTTPASRLRGTRAVELLEGLGTPVAKKLLAELEAGAAGAAHPGRGRRPEATRTTVTGLEPSDTAIRVSAAADAFPRRLPGARSLRPRL